VTQIAHNQEVSIYGGVNGANVHVTISCDNILFMFFSIIKLSSTFFLTSSLVLLISYKV